MRGETNRGAICGIVGILGVIAGAVLAYIGNYMANGYSSFYINLEYYYRTGGFDNTGKNLIIVGIVLIVLGVVLLLISLYFAIVSRRQFSKIMNNQEQEIGRAHV